MCKELNSFDYHVPIEYKSRGKYCITHQTGKKEDVLVDIIRGKTEHVRLRVGGGYIMLKDYADKQYGVKFRLNIKDSVKLKALEAKRGVEMYDSTLLMLKNYFNESMRRIARERQLRENKLRQEAARLEYLNLNEERVATEE